MRELPVALLLDSVVFSRKIRTNNQPIKNRFLKSFLYYVPYVTLAVMTFPAIMEATESPIAGLAALVIGILAAWFGLGLFPVEKIF